MTDTYAVGMKLVIWGVFGILAVISSLEVVCEVKHWPSISYRVEDWSIRNPWFSAALVLIVAMLLAHFVLNPLCPPDQPACP